MHRITRRRLELRQQEERHNRIIGIAKLTGIVAFYCAFFVFLNSVSGANNTNTYYRTVNNPQATEHYVLVTEREVSCKAVDVHMLQDSEGNLWEVSDYLRTGEEYSVIISDNATPGIITDDEIIKIREA